MANGRLSWSTGFGHVVLRVALGAVFIPHGLQKLRNPSAFAGFLSQLHVPAPTVTAWLVALLEAAGGALLIVGLLTRLVSLGLLLDMLVAIVSVKIRLAHAPFTSGKTPGWEFELMLAAAALTLIFTGPGNLAMDRLLHGKHPPAL
jgi:putative oxidoreductase